MRHKVKSHQRQDTGHRQAFVQRGHDVLHVGRCLDKEAANDGRDDGNRAQRQRVQHRIGVCASEHHGAQHHSGNQRDGVGLKQVGGHTGAVAHVVAYVVGNHGRVARVVLRNTGLYLANQVSAHIRTLGENAAAQTGKNRDQRGTKGKTNQRVELFYRHRAVRHQIPVKASHAQQAQANDQHAGRGATAKGNIQRRANAARGGLRGAHIGAH